MSADKGKFTEGSLMRHTAVMTATGGVGLLAIFFVDALNLFYIALLGETELAAAVGFAGAIQFFMISFSVGLTIAVSALTSRAIGGRDRAQARRIGGASILISAGVMSLVAALAWLTRDASLALLGATGETAVIASRFLAIALPSAPLLAIGMAASGLLRAVGDAQRAMYVTLVGGVFAAVADPVFIFALGLGVDGAAIVSVLSRAVIAAMGLRGAVMIHDLVARPRRADVAEFAGPLARIAAPAVATQLSTPFGLAYLTSAVAQYGDAAVAGWSVMGRMTPVFFAGVFSLSGAVGPILGQNYGAGRLDRVRGGYADAILFVLFYVAVMWALLILTAPLVISGFSLSEVGAGVYTTFAWIGGGGFLFTGVLFVSNATFNTLGRPLWSAGFNWARNAVLIPPFAIPFMAWSGAEGAVTAQAAASVVAGGAAAWIGWRYVRKLEQGAMSAPGGAASIEAPALASGRAAAAMTSGVIEGGRREDP